MVRESENGERVGQVCLEKCAWSSVFEKRISEMFVGKNGGTKNRNELKIWGILA